MFLREGSPIAEEVAQVGQLLGLLPGEAFRPLDASFRIASFTGAAPFAIAGCPFVVGVAPIVPAGGEDVAVHLAVDEEGGCVGAPRTSQVDLVGALGGT